MNPVDLAIGLFCSTCIAIEIVGAKKAAKEQGEEATMRVKKSIVASVARVAGLILCNCATIMAEPYLEMAGLSKSTAGIVGSLSGVALSFFAVHYITKKAVQLCLKKEYTSTEFVENLTKGFSPEWLGAAVVMAGLIGKSFFIEGLGVGMTAIGVGRKIYLSL